MREQFFKQLHELMTENKDVFFVTGDLGYGLADKIKKDFPDRFINVGAAEVTMMGVGVGLALQGKIPFVYSITPFLLWRPAEVIRNYLHQEQVPVIIVGSGRDNDYAHDGYSHFAGDDWKITDNMNIETYLTVPDLKNITGPAYINLSR